MRFASLAGVLMLCGTSVQASPVDEFWERMMGLCGKSFGGTLVVAPEASTFYAGKPLVVQVRKCLDDRIWIPFHVGEDRSQTWILSRREGRIVLRHDHRQPDGDESPVTMYGGRATNTGLAGQQFFPADQQTREMVAASFSNVWMLQVEPGKTLTYSLWRLGTPRTFRIDFDLSQTVDAPPPPWGWTD
ncbi:MAG: hypothetical protein LC637_00305 [Xanthomonadaceae bacterium]|nr:hypothetical protein [Xanthomonadaceae bacterium]